MRNAMRVRTRATVVTEHSACRSVVCVPAKSVGDVVSMQRVKEGQYKLLVRFDAAVFGDVVADDRPDAAHYAGTTLRSNPDPYNGNYKVHISECTTLVDLDSLEIVDEGPQELTA